MFHRRMIFYFSLLFFTGLEFARGPEARPPAVAAAPAPGPGWASSLAASASADILGTPLAAPAASSVRPWRIRKDTQRPALWPHLHWRLFSAFRTFFPLLFWILQYTIRYSLLPLTSLMGFMVVDF
jgi:hypothetical protein